jgi:hypothetical protein
MNIIIIVIIIMNTKTLHQTLNQIHHTVLQHCTLWQTYTVAVPTQTSRLLLSVNSDTAFGVLHFKLLWGVSLRYGGLESRWRHEHLCLANVVCCQVAVPAAVRSFIQESPTKCVWFFVTDFKRPQRTQQCICLLLLICTFLSAPQLVCL